jgi:hypothetical protein
MKERFPKILAGKLTRELIEELADRGYQLAPLTAEFGLRWWTDPDYPEQAHWQAECLSCGMSWNLTPAESAWATLQSHRHTCVNP